MLLAVKRRLECVTSCFKRKFVQQTEPSHGSRDTVECPAFSYKLGEFIIISSCDLWVTVIHVKPELKHSSSSRSHAASAVNTSRRCEEYSRLTHMLMRVWVKERQRETTTAELAETSTSAWRAPLHRVHQHSITIRPIGKTVAAVFTNKHLQATRHAVRIQFSSPWRARIYHTNARRTPSLVRY